MTAYSALAAWYDELTRDVPYAAFADYYERLFAERGGDDGLPADLPVFGMEDQGTDGGGQEIEQIDALGRQLLYLPHLKEIKQQQRTTPYPGAGQRPGSQGRQQIQQQHSSPSLSQQTAHSPIKHQQGKNLLQQPGGDFMVKKPA